MESNSSDVPHNPVPQSGSTTQLTTPKEEITQPSYPDRSTSIANNTEGVTAINENGDYPLTAPTPPFMGGRPGMLDASTRNSTATSMNFQGSEYGSVAPLNKDGAKTPGAEVHPLGEMGAKAAPALNEKEIRYEAPRSQSKRKLIWGLAALLLAIVIIAVVVPVYFLVVKKKDDGGSGSTGSSGGHDTGSGDNNSTGEHTPAGVTWGGDGSTVTKEDGTTFIYNNSFGGYWVYDSQNPLNNSARCQDSSPPLSEKWKWGEDIIYGVNLGGWINLEPFISPALYEPFYPNAIDEWSLSELIQARDGNLNAIEEHYKTFIVEEDFAMIAAAGLNWVRIPIPFWVIEVYPGEPFLARTGWTYFLKAIEWARKYGLRINLDLHAVPGSQNGWNHSGKHGQINFLAGTMGVANAQRTLDYIRIIAEFISQPEYSPVVPFFGILNEPNGLGDGGIPQAAMQEFYAEAYRVVRRASGLGDGNGPMIGLHEAFYGFDFWYGFLDGADRLALDSHPYLVFGSVSADPVTAYPPQPCSRWGSMFGDPMNQFGMVTAGEWSYAINDCGLYVNQVGSGTRYEGTYNGNARIGDCTADGWLDYRTWDDTIKDSLRGLAMSTMDALGNSFFWTWRIGESSETGRVMAPFWSYKLSVQEGWAPTDPRTSKGNCERLGQTGNSYSGTMNTNSAGGPGAGDSVPSLDTFAWPPTVVGGYGAAALLPTYTPTGPLVTLPVPQATQGVNVDFGDGWNNADDTDLMNVPISGCDYPDPWNAVSAAVPVC